MSDYRNRDDFERRRRDGADDRARQANGFDRQAHLSAEAQARANATGTYPGPSRTASGARGNRRAAGADDARRRQAEYGTADRSRRAVEDDRLMGDYRNERPNREDGRRSRTGQEDFYRDDNRTRYRSGREDAQRRQQAQRRGDPRRRQRPDQYHQGSGQDEANRDASRRGQQDRAGEGAPKRRPSVKQSQVQHPQRSNRRAEGAYRSRRNDAARQRRQPQGEDPRLQDAQLGSRDVADAQRRRQAGGDPRAQQAQRGRRGADMPERIEAMPDEQMERIADERARRRRARMEQGAYQQQAVRQQRVAAAAMAAAAMEASAEVETSQEQADRASARAKTPDEPKKASPSSPSPFLDEEELSPANRTFFSYAREFAILGFNGLLTLGLVLGLCFFLRPSVSQAENRELTAFPEFSLQSFIDGDFTEGVSTWYADTFPFRDRLMAINQRLKSFYGYESSTQMYGTAATADDIPTETVVEEETKKDPVAPETYDSWNLEEDIQGQIMQGLYVKDGAVYATYGFTQEAANDYVNAVNNAADKLEGTTQVYSILIPNNSGVLLGEEELAALGGSNQGQAIQYYYDSYNDKVKTIDTMDTLLKHKDDYLFFRTDHHWTALAAYYVYLNFCEAKGVEPHLLDQFEEQDFSPFLGSYYIQLQLDSLAANPDTVQAWVPMGTNDMTYTDVDGSVIEWNVIRDVSDWDDGTKYNCFVAGDEPWAEIHNPAITDGSSCVVVKESYGNAFIPWLVDHYETVYIADFRYTNVNVADFCAENNVTDLILLNNISIIGSVDVAGKIASIL